MKEKEREGKSIRKLLVTAIVLNYEMGNAETIGQMIDDHLRLVGITTASSFFGALASRKEESYFEKRGIRRGIWREQWGTQIERLSLFVLFSFDRF